MELSQQQKRALDAMGIPIWQLRNTTTPTSEQSTSEKAVDPWVPLQQTVTHCTACGLDKCRTQTVFGVGDHQADLLIVGEAPGANEDKQGEPFVGRAGQLLNGMLKSIGLERERIFITNILKCRPPNNRDPKPEEVKECLPYLHQQIALLKPKLIVAVGRIAAQNLLQVTTSLGRLRGNVHTYAATETPLLVSYHPAYLLRAPKEKAKALKDLWLIKKFLDEDVAN